MAAALSRPGLIIFLQMPAQYIAGTVWLHLAVIAFLSTLLQIVSALPSGRVSQVLSPAQHPGRFHIFPTFSVTSDSGSELKADIPCFVVISPRYCTSSVCGPRCEYSERPEHDYLYPNVQR